MAADEITALMRRWRRDEDRWKPVLWLPMDPMDAWGGTWSLEYRDRDRDGDLDLETSYAYSLWFDWPPELLATDDKTSLRLAFAGLAVNRGVDALRRMRARVTFEYGAEALADVERCVEDHRKGGRLDVPPMDLDVEAPPLLLPPSRW